MEQGLKRGTCSRRRSDKEVLCHLSLCLSQYYACTHGDLPQQHGIAEMCADNKSVAVGHTCMSSLLL